MKRLFVILLLTLIASTSYASRYHNRWSYERKRHSQMQYVGMYYSDKYLARPYFYYRLDSYHKGNLYIHSIIGGGLNSFGQPNITFGQDWVIGRIVLSEGIRFFGYNSIYKTALPEARAGVELGNIKIMGSINWNARQVYIQNHIGYEPYATPTIGIFYSF